jgi:hypothetical protein
MSRPLYAIGDIHGDAARLVAILTKHGLIDTSAGSVKWAKPGVIVLLMGDVVDAKSRSGEFGDMIFQGSLSDMWILEFLVTASQEADKMGSSVLALLGNHELMNCRGHFDWVSPHHVPSVAMRRAYFMPGGGGYKALCTLFHTSVTYNGNHYSHAGIPLEASSAQKRMLGKRVTPALLDMQEDPDLENLLSHRDYLAESTKSSSYAADIVCKRNMLTSMVIGHNFTGGEGIVSDYGGRVIYTDVGHSRAFTLTSSPQTCEIVFDDGSGSLQVLRADGSLSPIPVRQLA